MYCPKCSQPQTSEQVRFCSRCGFQLNVVKELLASDTAPTTKAETLVSRPKPSRKDLNVGSTLMLIGAVLAALSTSMLVGPPTVAIGAALLVLTAVFFFILLFSQFLLRALNKIFSEGEEQASDLALRRSDVNTGALIMFMATSISIFIALFSGADMRVPILGIALVSFVFTFLFSNRLAQSFHHLFTAGASDPNPVSQLSSDTRNPHSLPSAQSIPIDNTTSRVNTAEMVQPPSITEHTTTLLDKT